MKLRHRETSTWLALHLTTSNRWMEGFCLQVNASCGHSAPNQPSSLPRITHSYSPSLSFPPPSPTSAITMLPVERLNLHIYRNMWWVNHSIFFKIKNHKMIQHLMIIFSKFKHSYLIDKQCPHPFQSLSVTRNNDIESSFNEDLKWLLLTKLSEVNKYLTRRYQDIVLWKGSYQGIIKLFSRVFSRDHMLDKINGNMVYDFNKAKLYPWSCNTRYKKTEFQGNSLNHNKKIEMWNIMNILK